MEEEIIRNTFALSHPYQVRCTMFVNQNRGILGSMFAMSVILLGTLASSPATAQSDLSLLAGATIPSRGFNDEADPSFSVGAYMGFAPKGQERLDLIWSITHSKLEGTEQIPGYGYILRATSLWDFAIGVRPYLRARNSNFPVYFLAGLGGFVSVGIHSNTRNGENTSFVGGGTTGGFSAQGGAGVRIAVASHSSIDVQGRYLFTVPERDKDSFDRMVIEAGISHTWGD